MRHSLFIHLQDYSGDQVSWAIFNQTGQLVESSEWVSLETIPLRNYLTTFVLVPTLNILLTMVNVPTKQWQRIVQATPYVLEEQLAEDIGNLHFALGERDAQLGTITTAIIKKAQIEIYKRLLGTIGLNSTTLMPDVLAVPYPAEGWGIVCLNKIALVRIGLQGGFAIEFSSLILALQMTLVDCKTQPPQRIFIFKGLQPCPIDMDALKTLGIPITEQTHEQGILAWLVQGLTKTKPLNLLQGEYRPVSKITVLWRPWRLTAILFVLWSALQVGKQVVEYQHLKHHKHLLLAQIETLYRKTFPDAHTIVDPRLQMEQQLEILRKQHKHTTLNESFLVLLTQLSEPFKQTSGLTIRRIDYHQDRFNVQLETPTWQSLEQLKQYLSKANFVVEVQSATSHNQVVEGHLLIYKAKNN